MRSEPHTANPAELKIGGLRLEQHAGVCAALGLGFPLSDALANDRIEHATWLRAAPAWAAKLAASDSQTAIRRAYTARLAEADVWLGRRIKPLDEDLESWLSFLGAWSAAPAQLSLLSGLGLTTSDIARLQQGWTRRMAADPALCRRALEIALRRPSRLPAVQVIPATLRPFPWSDRAPATTRPSRPVGHAAPPTTPPKVAVLTPSFMRNNPSVGLWGG
jgi:hypothetical protein